MDIGRTSKSGARSLQTDSTELTQRVLLVDDEPALVAAISRLLSRRDYQVTCATTPLVACSELAKRRFDCIVSDVHMPGINGVDLLRVAREHDPDVPVVLMTGAPDFTTAASAVALGAFRYLNKPITYEELENVVSLAVDAGRAARLKREFVEEYGSGVFRAGDQMSVDAALDRALGSLWMAYQPIVQAGLHSVFACEALLRCDEPQLPDPGSVIDAAQRTRRLFHLGRTVRERVAADLRADVAHDGPLFVNLHPEDLLDPALSSPSSPLSALASRIVLEVTERASLDNMEDLLGRLTELRALGYRVALDDLGAGYAGLSSLTRLDPDFIKLDMSLTRDIDQSPLKRRLVRAMVELCHDMDKLLVAEGVESAGEMQTLEDLGCDYLQGYLFSKPMRTLAAASLAPAA